MSKVRELWESEIERICRLYGAGNLDYSEAKARLAMKGLDAIDADCWLAAATDETAP